MHRKEQGQQARSSSTPQQNLTRKGGRKNRKKNSHVLYSGEPIAFYRCDPSKEPLISLIKSTYGH
jgi:hypothetical protein